MRALLITLLLLLSGCVSDGPQRAVIDNARAAEANAKLGLGYMLNGNYETA
ncbi:MAG: type IV pilus biogenesis/stability protein PilW, partial [Gammaproteobacteria bacterium]|nr:type IV pilus biogenesis/stability protein PilW [Gammaproteobacteria bacterium]